MRCLLFVPLLQRKTTYNFDVNIYLCLQETDTSMTPVNPASGDETTGTVD